MWKRAGLAAVAALLLAAGCASSALLADASSQAASSGRVPVASCPVPGADYRGTPFSPRPAPATLRLPASVTVPAQAQAFGTTFLPGAASYLLGPRSAACQAGLASADGGEAIDATPVSHRSESVLMVISPGGIGPSTDLACPYIPAVRAADVLSVKEVPSALLRRPM